MVAASAPGELDRLITQVAALPGTIAAQMAALTEALAQSRATSIVGSSLQLASETPAPLPALHLDADLDTAATLGEVYQRLLAWRDRHEGGVHYTPVDMARSLTERAIDGWHASLANGVDVLDPSVGGGAFLLAAAQVLHGRCGGTRASIVDRLAGVDLDPIAVAVAEATLWIWCAEVDGTPAADAAIEASHFTSGNALLDELPMADLVVGNPPFLSQLGKGTARTAKERRVLRERFGSDVGAYADSASLILLASLDALRPSGRLVLVQPLSLLGSDHNRAVRSQLSEHRTLGIWSGLDNIFEADVRVCAPIVEKAPAPSGDLPVRRFVGVSAEEIAASRLPDAASWAPILSGEVGLPQHELTGTGALGDLADVTAGFRDQFYGFAPHALELSDSRLDPVRHARLVTVGMIDPLRLRWGTGQFRFAKRTWDRPAVDLDELERANPELAAWTRARLVPKVLVATQTKVVEAVVDPKGSLVPVTPTISVEAYDTDDLYRLAAVLTAPPVTLALLARRLGAALSLAALRFSASDLASIPLPHDGEVWTNAALELQNSDSTSAPEWHAALLTCGEKMNEAYGAPSSVFDWWAARLPPWR